ncbi:hypothetical protein B5X24_HaOG203037 [Helicoverpa armigera]|uniref:Alpha 1,4-glycosyltransferase domain-containing protein n=1 Tax=Helicoverpa armigera TaxID=29058 RepID=A0A2W1BX16_HELAM|nr:hypothetical protein B5X24_HaOG203037 [Helicoverpa armigera]
MYFQLLRIMCKYKFYILIPYAVIFYFAFIWYFWNIHGKYNYKYVEHATWWKTEAVEEPCHVSRENDVLELVTEKTKIPLNSIFFHHTSCTIDLSSRQACAIESAAKTNPERQINVLFISSIEEDTLRNGSLSTILDKYKNVKLRRVLISDYASRTPLESTVANISVDNDILFAQMSKIMKYLTLYKYSGIYLSFDVIVARNLDLRPNWVVKSSPASLSADMFAFSNDTVGRKLANGAMGFLKSELLNKELDFWSYNAPSALTHLLSRWCTTDQVEQMTSNVCQDIAVHDPKMFYPIDFHDRKQYFENVDWEEWKKKEIYTYFIYEQFTKYSLVPPLSLYGRIANEYCPLTYERSTDKKGLWYYM